MLASWVQVSWPSGVVTWYRVTRTPGRVLALTERQAHFGRLLPANVDGAIAAISADLGFSYELGNAIFLISRLPGLIAHAHEERMRQEPMRRIDPMERLRGVLGL